MLRQMEMATSGMALLGLVLDNCKVLRAILVPQERLALRVQLVHKAWLAPLASKVQLVHKAWLEPRAIPEQLALLAHKVLLVLRELRATKATLARLV